MKGGRRCGGQKGEPGSLSELLVATCSLPVAALCLLYNIWHIILGAVNRQQRLRSEVKLRFKCGMEINMVILGLFSYRLLLYDIILKGIF